MADQHQDSPKLPEQKASGIGQSEKPNLSPEDQLLARRRKLLKGLVAGVPAIITLQSGAALAGTSIPRACLDTSQGKKLTTMNVGGRCKTAGAVTGNEEWHYAPPQGNTSVFGVNSGPGGGTKYCLPYMTANGILATQNQPAANRWGALATGGGTDAGPVSGTYYAVKQSCWTSFYR
ncbi:MAG: hypothetical protein HQL71_02895 [Magnetococcales bacterium]|nr:hypothetical protein [Magnetococcales bacterium]